MPTVALASGEIKPFVVASRNPNGAVAVATLGLTLCPNATERQWITGEVANVALQVGEISGPIGVFGRYHSLTLTFDKSVVGQRILAQDLAGENAEDITALVRIAGNQIVIPGKVIADIGRRAATPGDKFDPGLVLVIRQN